MSERERKEQKYSAKASGGDAKIPRIDRAIGAGRANAGVLPDSIARRALFHRAREGCDRVTQEEKRD